MDTSDTIREEKLIVEIMWLGVQLSRWRVVDVFVEYSGHVDEFVCRVFAAGTNYQESRAPLFEVFSIFSTEKFVDDLIHIHAYLSKLYAAHEQEEAA